MARICVSTVSHVIRCIKEESVPQEPAYEANLQISKRQLIFNTVHDINEENLLENVSGRYLHEN